MFGWKRQSIYLASIGLSVSAMVAAPEAAAQEVDAQEPPALTEQQRQRLEELEQRFIERVSEALELTDEQTVQLRRTLRASRQERADLLRSRVELRRELNRAIAETKPDNAKIQALLDQRSALDRRQSQVGQAEEQRLGEFMSPVQKARFMYLRQRMAQALRDRVRQTDRQRPQQRPRRPSGADRPRTDQARDAGPRADSRIATPSRPAAGATRAVP